MVEFVEETRDDVTILRMIGSVQAADNEKFAREIQGLLEDGKIRLVIDATNLDYLNSRAMGELVAYYQRARATNGNLALVNLKPMVAKILRAIGLSTLIGCYRTIDEALRSIQQKD